MKGIFKNLRFRRVIKNNENLDKKVHIISDITMSAFINRR